MSLLTPNCTRAIGGLEGQIIKQEEAGSVIKATFDKNILGNVIGDQAQMDIKIETPSPEESTIFVEAKPLDPVGWKIMSGACKGVSQTVVTWFFAYLDHRLPKSEEAYE